jgi:PLP dependent protein
VSDDPRSAQIAANLAQVRDRIAAAAKAAGRDPAELTVIGITKTFPAEDARRLVRLGVPDLGENRDQDARVKAREVPEARWHFVGRLQRNKAASVASYAAVVHSLDRPELVGALANGVRRAERDPLDVLVQVSIDGDPARGGAVANGADPARDLWRVAAAVAEAEGLRLGGVMAVAPRGWEPERAFATLAELAGRIRTDHPGAAAVSAGMSGDLEQAVRHGATHVRIGTSLLGMRNPLR